MSFEDYRSVEFDYGHGTFNIIKNNGNVYTYSIEDEPDLVRNIFENERDVLIYEIAPSVSSLWGFRWF